jgi:hypothetical protein
MPYLRDYDLADYESGKHEQGSEDWRIKEAVLLMSKTPVPLVFNDEEKQKISSAGADAYEKVVNPKIEFYLGPSYRAEGETEADGCEELDDAAEPSIDYDNMVEFNWDFYQSQLYDYARNYFWTLSCIQTGKVEGEKCSGTKYVSTPTSSSTLSNELTEEEKEILAERERDSQGSTGSTETLNVTPFQLCDSLGQVVQTESYGQLICKYVLINRIRTLAWIRS